MAVIAATIPSIASASSNSPTPQHPSTSTSAPSPSSSTSAPSPSTTTPTTSPTPGNPVCGYLYEWIHAWLFPLQPDAHAAYSAIVPSVTTDPIAYVIKGPMPYASWMSWMVYDSKAVGFSLQKGEEIVPDAGSTNPFVVGNQLMAPSRNYTVLILPKGATGVDPTLQAIPNMIETPDPADPASGNWSLIVNRVYNAFPGYDLAGARGATNTPFPSVTAVNYKTGEPVDCAQYNLLPNNGKPPTETPAEPGNVPIPGLVRLKTGETIPIGFHGFQQAPQIDPDLITFTRPPLLPGADLPSVPPPDSCAGYLGARTDPNRIGLIRVPKLPSTLVTTDVDETSTFVQKDVTFYSFDMYGALRQEYAPGFPRNASIGNQQVLNDGTGGATIVVWPRDLPLAEKDQVVALARSNSWTLMRGGADGPVTSANMLVRMKRADPNYPSRTSNLPCFFDNQPPRTPWSELQNAADPTPFVASFNTLGAGAPQGVNCTVEEFLNGTCLANLKSYISSTGGSYTPQT
jgi:hypothetical protein